MGGVEASVGPHSTAGHEKEVNRKGCPIKYGRQHSKIMGKY
jgi:hypothetical protein